MYLMFFINTCINKEGGGTLQHFFSTTIGSFDFLLQELTAIYKRQLTLLTTGKVLIIRGKHQSILNSSN